MSNISEELKWLPQPCLTTGHIAHRRLIQAYNHAREVSPDPSTKNGAILVSHDNEILSYGVNKFPTGVAATESRLLDKTTKYRLIVHAENGAVFNAARHGKVVNGSTLYCPFYSCSECAKAIIQSGIVRVVGHAQLMALAAKHTIWVQSITDAWNVLHEAGVQCDLYDGTLGVVARFNGRDVWV